MGRIEIDGLTKRYGSEVAVEDLSLEIEDGEFLVLVGPSGCGKTTTLRCIAGLESPTEGTVRFDGEVQNHRTPQERDIAMVFQDYALYPHMTVRGNLHFGLEEEEGYTSEEREERVEEVADLLGIADLLDRNPTDLSGGQQQRVALGRAIVREPEVFLMDEPLANLDAKLRAQMRTELQQLQDDLGVTTIYVTHDQTEAMTMSDRIAVMDDGLLQQVGEPLDVYHAPANRFVAGFIGEPTMNFFEGDRSEGAFVSEHLSYPFDDGILDAIGEHDELVFGVRPEAVDLRQIEGDADLGERAFEMEVTVVEPMGDENVVHLRFPEQAEEHDEMTVLTDELWGLRSGDTVGASIPIDAVHVFDRDSGEALHTRRREADQDGEFVRQ